MQALLVSGRSKRYSSVLQQTAKWQSAYLPNLPNLPAIFQGTKLLKD